MVMNGDEFHGEFMTIRSKSAGPGCDLRYNTALAAAKKNWTIALALLSEVQSLRLGLESWSPDDDLRGFPSGLTGLTICLKLGVALKSLIDDHFTH